MAILTPDEALANRARPLDEPALRAEAMAYVARLEPMTESDARLMRSYREADPRETQGEKHELWRLLQLYECRLCLLNHMDGRLELARHLMFEAVDPALEMHYKQHFQEKIEDLKRELYMAIVASGGQ